MNTFAKNHLIQLALTLAFALSAMALPETVQAALVKKTIDYHLAGRPYEGYFAYDDSVTGPRPGILVAHDWMGVSDKTRARVEQLAELGYAVFAVDIYGKGVRPTAPGEAGKQAGSFKKDRVALRARMQQGLKVLKEQAQTDKSKIAVLGYCFGGTAAIELARAGADVKGVLSFHGGLDSPKPEGGKKIKGRVIAFHGADDPHVSAPDLKAFEDEMRAAKVDWQLVAFGGAVHSFTDKSAGTDPSKGNAYNEAADRRSWQYMQGFLKEIF